MNTQLLRKEIALQRTNLMFLAGVLLFWGLLYIASFFASASTGFGRLTVGEIVLVLNLLVVCPALVLLLPCMAGAVTVASERQLGTLDWELSLPHRRWGRWKLKSFLAIVFAFVTGGVAVTLLTYLLARNLSARGTIITESGWLLRGLVPLFYSLFFAACGLYASTLARDSYRALMSAIGLALFTFYVARAIIDPTGMLWPFYPNHGVFTNYTAHALVLVFLTLLLLFLGYRNYRFERATWRRLAAQMIVWTIVANATGWYLLKQEYNTFIREQCFPGSVPVTQLLGYNTAWRRNYPPYLTQALPPGYKGQEVVGSNPIRFNPDQLLVGYGGHMARVDVPNASVQQYPQVQSEFVERIDPGGRGFASGGWLVTDFPLPVHTRSWWGRLLFQSGLLGKGVFSWKSLRTWRPLVPSFLDDEGKRRELSNDARIPTRMGTSLVAVDDRSTEPQRTYLFRRKATSGNGLDYDLVAEGYADVHDWCVSPDEEWYTRRSLSQNSLAIIRTDNSTSHTINSHGGLLRVGSSPASSVPYDRDTTCEMGQRKHILPVSPDGRYLAFIRTKPANIQVNGKELCPGFPESIEVCLLDLKSGNETTVTKLQPGPGDVAAMEALLHQNLTGAPCYNDRLSLQNDRWTFVQSGLPMAWSKDGRLAILNDGALYICEPKASGGGFNVVRINNIPNAGTNIEFWNNNTLLVWGKQGLWRVDLIHPHRIADIVSESWTSRKDVTVMNQ